MAYFLPSFFQKRLLRYALSRLGLVDTEALDLDSLGIRWGQRSTVELRDIGLRLDVSALIVPPMSLASFPGSQSAAVPRWVLGHPACANEKTLY